MTTTVIRDPASLQRLGMLAEQMTKLEMQFAARCEFAQARDRIEEAAQYRAQAARCGWVASRARDTLVRLSGLDESGVLPAPGLADLMSEPEPPRTVDGLVGWLKARLGRWFPSVPAEIWAGMAFVLHHHRGPRP